MNDRSSDLRSDLVGAAGRLLAQREVSAVTAREIARHARLSDGVLYNYFQDKSELVLEALVQQFERLAAELEDALPEPGAQTVPASLLQLAEALFRFHRASLPMLSSVLADPPLLRRFMAAIHGPHQYSARVREPIADYLAAEQRRGRIAGVDVASATDLLIGGTAILALNGERGRRRLRRLTTTFANGLEADS